MKDCKALIIGAGPAGLSAAIYLARFKIDTTVIYEEQYGSALETAGIIENYPGVQGCLGNELLNKFRTQAEELNVNFVEAEAVKIELHNRYKDVTVFLNGKKQLYTAQAVLIASGSKPRKLGIKGEDTISGISYCAVCDASLYKNKAVAVIGGGETAFSEADLLSQYCEKVYIIHRKDNFKRVTQSMQEKIANKGNIFFLKNSKVIGFNSCKEKLNGLHLLCGENPNRLDTSYMLPVDGCFLAIGSTPNVFQGLELEKDGRIKVDNKCETSMTGVYAAGDCSTEKRQVVVAASSGALAAFSIKEYLDGFS